MHIQKLQSMGIYVAISLVPRPLSSRGGGAWGRGYVATYSDLVRERDFVLLCRSGEKISDGL